MRNISMIAQVLAMVRGDQKYGIARQLKIFQGVVKRPDLAVRVFEAAVVEPPQDAQLRRAPACAGEIYCGFTTNRRNQPHVKFREEFGVRVFRRIIRVRRHNMQIEEEFFQEREVEFVLGIKEG